MARQQVQPLGRGGQVVVGVAHHTPLVLLGVVGVVVPVGQRGDFSFNDSKESIQCRVYFFAAVLQPSMNKRSVTLTLGKF